MIQFSFVLKKSVHVFGELLYLRYVVLVSLVLLLKRRQIREERRHFYLTMPHTKKCCHGIILHGQPATGQKLGVIWTIGSWSMSMIRATWTHMIHDHDPGNWFDEDHGSWSWSDHCANVDHDHPKSMVMIQNPHEFLPVVFFSFFVFILRKWTRRKKNVFIHLVNFFQSCTEMTISGGKNTIPFTQP